ncbi:hypothetical protein K469DRAFT_447339, partial [Zopfia rhizophila CBS 207.26]
DIPKCALQCFISSLNNDGCKSETDFQCHCSKGNILAAASPCVRKECNEGDEEEALDVVGAACRAAGVNLGDGGDGQMSPTPSPDRPNRNPSENPTGAPAPSTPFTISRQPTSFEPHPRTTSTFLLPSPT